MIGGLARSPSSISVNGLPAGSYILFPNSDDAGKWYSKDYQGNIAPVGALNPVIGGNRVFQRREDQQNSTSTDFTTYLQINVTNPNAFNVLHELFVSFIWGYGSSSSDFVARLLLNGVQIGEEFRKEPKDPGSDQRHPEIFMDELTLIPGVNTLALQFAAGVAGTQARLYSAKMRSQRV